MTIVNRKNHLLYTKAIEWGTKQFPFPLLRVVSTSLFFVMPTEECTYVEKSFDFDTCLLIFIVLIIKTYVCRKLVEFELCTLNFKDLEISTCKIFSIVFL